MQLGISISLTSPLLGGGVSIGQPVTLSKTGASGQTVSFTLSDDRVSRGVFGDGTPWVLAGSAQMTASTPTHVSETGSASDKTYSTAIDRNGMMVNPGISNVPSGTLAERQDDNCVLANGQGWDEADGHPDSDRETIYVSAQNVDPGKTGQSISLSSENTYVKCVSRPLSGVPDAREVVQDLIPLTVVASAPSHTDSARPALSLPDKSSRWRTSDIVLPTKHSLTFVDTPRSYAEALEFISYLQHDMKTDNTASRSTTPGEEEGYGGFTAQYLLESFLCCFTDVWTDPQRLEIARAICQAAEDGRGRVLQGGVWNRNGGWSQKVDATLRAAEVFLPGMFTDAIDTLIETESALTGLLGIFTPQRALSEMDRVELVSQEMIDYSGFTNPFTQDMYGWPEFCESFGRDFTLENRPTLENSLGEDGVTFPDSAKVGYRHIAMKAMVPLTLGLRLAGSSQINTNVNYWNYVDRHVTAVQGGANEHSNPIAPWVLEMWTALRGTPVWEPEVWSITEGVGQATIVTHPIIPATPVVTLVSGVAVLETS